MNPKIVISILLFVFLVHLAVADVTEAELRDLREENIGFKEEVYESIKRYIDDNPDFVSAFQRADEIYYKLAELSADLYINEPQVPLEYYRRVLDLNPHHPNRDAILYNIGYFSSEYTKQTRDRMRSRRVQQIIDDERVEAVLVWTGGERLSEESLEETIGAYREILLNHPESEYYNETLFRLAVLYYDIGIDADVPRDYYLKANELFNVLASQEGEEFQHLGLYQRAWSFFSTHDYEKAIRDFVEILNILDERIEFRAFFESDAIENIAYSLERMDGGDYISRSSSVFYAKDNLPKILTNDDHLKQILNRVIEIKLELSAPFHAVDYHELFVELYPLNLTNPTLIFNIAETYQNYGYIIGDDVELRELIISQKERLINNHKYDSEWYRQNNTHEDFSAEIEVIRDAYVYMEPIYWNRFVLEQTSDHYSNYRRLIAGYRKYPEFGDEKGDQWVKLRVKNLVEASLSLANNEELPGYYIQANAVISDFNDKYPDNVDFYTYERDRYLAVEYLYESLYEELADSTYYDEINDFVITEDYLNDLFIRGNTDFLTLFNEPELLDEEYKEDVISALYKRSQFHLRRGDYIEAEEYLIAILDFDIDNELKRSIYVYLAQVNENLNNYEQAELYYRNASEYALDADDKENIKNQYRRQIQAKANSLADDESHNEAAEEFLRLASEFSETDPSRFIGLKQQAVDSYIKGGEYQKAIGVLVEMTAVRTDPEAAYFLYASAWEIADTLMNDNSRVKELQNEFVDNYPTTNQAFRTRYEMAERLSTSADTKYLAGDMLFELHNDARNGEIDTGEFATEDIYYDALNLYYDNPDQELVMDMMLEFEKLYPQDERADKLLELVAMYYNEEGRDQDFEELARYIFQKDPESKFYENIAGRNLLAIYNDATSLFEAEKYEEMLVRIEDFKELDQRYQRENLKLQLDDFYYDFENYELVYQLELEYQEYLVRMENAYQEIESGFVNAEPGSLIRINTMTKWTEHISGGANRLDGIVSTANNHRDTILSLIQGANELNREIPLEMRTKGLYLIGKIYDYSADVVEQQIERFISISPDMAELRDWDEEQYQSTIATIRQNFKIPYANYLRSESANWYSQLISIFEQGMNHQDEYTDLASIRLSEWGLLTEQIVLYSNTDWLATHSEYRANVQSLDWKSVYNAQTLLSMENVIGLEDTKAIPIWFRPEIVSTEEGDIEDESAEETITTEQPTLYMKSFEIEGEVTEAVMVYLSYDKSTIWINGKQIASELTAVEETDGSYVYAQTIVLEADDFIRGENVVMIETYSDLENGQGIVFELSLTVNK